MSFDIDTFAAEIRTISNRQLIERAADAIHADAVMSSFRSYKGEHGDKATALYAEADRRGNTDLYQRAFNSVAREQGHSSMASPVATPIEAGDPTLPVTVTA